MNEGPEQQPPRQPCARVLLVAPHLKRSARRVCLCHASLVERLADALTGSAGHDRCNVQPELTVMI